jgi:hypothetical protein
MPRTWVWVVTIVEPSGSWLPHAVVREVKMNAYISGWKGSIVSEHIGLDRRVYTLDDGRKMDCHLTPMKG